MKETNETTAAPPVDVPRLVRPSGSWEGAAQESADTQLRTPRSPEPRPTESCKSCGRASEHRPRSAFERVWLSALRSQESLYYWARILKETPERLRGAASRWRELGYPHLGAASADETPEILRALGLPLPEFQQGTGPSAAACDH